MAKKSQTQVLFDAFERLSSREKVLVVGLASAVFITVCAVLWLVVGKQISVLEQRNITLRENLAQVVTLKEGYLEQKAEFDAVDAKLKNNSIRLVRLMETEAGHQGITIEDFKEGKRFLTNKKSQFRKRSRGGEKRKVKELVEETQTVTMRRITLAQLTNFLAALENRREPVTVTKLMISTLNSDRQVLREIRMTVATYRYEEVEI